MEGIAKRIKGFPNIGSRSFSVGYTIPSPTMCVEIGFFPIHSIEIFKRIIDGTSSKRFGVIKSKRWTKKILVANQQKQQNRKKED
jgi:hypothetical protein